MANWTDGPEYAPLDRPAAFQGPSAEPLEVPPAVPNPAAGAPVELPSWQPPQAAVPPLAALAPAASLPARDPRTEFSAVSSLVTGTSAWGSAHSTGAAASRTWTPDQPLPTSAVVVPPMPAPAAATGAMPAVPVGVPQQNLNFPPPTQAPPSFPQPGTPDWFAPPPQTRWQPPSPTVTIAQLWHGATPGVILTLLVGALINPLAPAMLAVAGFLAGRVKYRVEHVRRCFVWAVGLVVAIGVVSLVNADFQLGAAWEVVSGWSQVACWVLAIAVPLLVGAGIRANEPPRRPN
ncbi:MAG: hypothetical protein QM695_11630 [Micropruina sp.]